METRLRTPVYIYECYVEYIRPQNGEEPQMKTIFPKDYQFDKDTRKNLTTFLFPLKDCNTSSEEHFTFTLTNLEGQFRFGFCRYPAKGDVCACFLSDLPWFKVFYRVMDKISDMQLSYQSEMVQPFLRALHQHPIPNLTTDSILTFKLDDLDGQVFTFPLPTPRRLPEIPTDHNFTLFYPSLHHEVFLCLFANLIFERRIIITSNSLSMLSASIHSVASLLYPLFWQHIFIPLTPCHLIDYCTAPMPFLMGVHSSIMEQVRRMPINDAVILDIDLNELETPYTEDLLRMPPHITSHLRHILKKESSAYGDTVTKALLNAMVAMFGGYRTALKIREGESKVSFDEDSFIQSRPHMEDFLGELLHFQHFQQFIKNRMDRLSRHRERDIFDEEAIVYDEEGKSGKFSSDQIKKGFKEIRGMLKHQGKKAIESTGTLMKDTQKMFQGKMLQEKVGPGDYSTLQNSPLGLVGLGRNKSSTIDGRTSDSSPLSKPRMPPPVVPYHRHQEGKEKLRKSLYLQDKRLSLGDGVSFLRSGIFNEDTESLDSKESAGSGEVITGNLIDIDDDMEMRRRPSLPVPMIIRSVSDDEDDTDSASIISSNSSDSATVWEGIHIQNEGAHAHDVGPLSPPVPIAPPRRNRKNMSTPDPSGPLIDLDSESPKYNQLQQSTNAERGGSDSPLSDFTSSIAEQLVSHSKRLSDPRFANTMSNTGLDLLQTLDAPPHNYSTPTAMANNNNKGETRAMSLIPEATWPINDPWKPLNSSPNLSGSNSPSRPRKPPPKPQPYAGTGVKVFVDMSAAQPGAVLTPTTTAQDPSKKSSDPFDVFGTGGLHAYAFDKNRSTDTSSS